ncbi:hypothetical protein L2E82_02080 [Cichorium intybus]|uniref:Uncharacterized protein n=1 Tax=Cichorium intybus TaxID=13427 RepID=A0ACB9H1Q7_CICIN|nr:hypothetical protein L2E82_02080 [Cichorium intybus]
MPFQFNPRRFNCSLQLLYRCLFTSPNTPPLAKRGSNFILVAVFWVCSFYVERSPLLKERLEASYHIRVAFHQVVHGSKKAMHRAIRCWAFRTISKRRAEGVIHSG